MKTKVAEKPIVLIVNNNETELWQLARFLEHEGYKCLWARRLSQLDKILQKAGKVTVAIIDIAGFGDTLWAYCGLFREQKVHFFIISPERNLVIQEHCLRYNAIGLLIKPITNQQLLEAIRSLPAS